VVAVVLAGIGDLEPRSTAVGEQVVGGGAAEPAGVDHLGVSELVELDIAHGGVDAHLRADRGERGAGGIDHRLLLEPGLVEVEGGDERGCSGSDHKDIDDGMEWTHGDFP
jgi:hypothetical protein